MDEKELRRPRPSLSVRWGTWVARHRWWVLGVWIMLLVGAVLVYPHLMDNLSAPDYSVTGSDSAQVADLIEADFSAAGVEQDVIVFDSETLKVADREYRSAIDRVIEAVKAEPGVVAVVSPTDVGAQGQISEDERSAFASLGLNGDDRQRADRSAALQDVVASALGSAPVEAYLTGYSQSANDLTEVENADVERAESIGIPIALIVLVIALGAVVAGLIPLITALCSLMFTFGVLSLLITWRPMDSFLLSIVTMIGVGISIDYSLFILSRYREELFRAHARGAAEPVVTAVGVAMRTSGRTILFSGTIVMISLFSLFVVKSPLFIGMALGAVLVVVCTLITAWTMLPALLAALGHGVDKLSLPERWQPATDAEDGSVETGGWARWARTVLRHPWLALPAVALLVLFALPMFSMELGIDLGLAAISDTATGKAEIILLDKFSPGLLSPVQILATHEGSGALSGDDLTDIQGLTNALAEDPRVAGIYSVSTLLEETVGEVSPKGMELLQQDPTASSYLAQTVNVDDGSNRTIITVVTKAPIDSTEATELVRDLRDDIIPSYEASAGPQMLVGGETAQFEDLGVETLSKLPLVMAIVLGLSFVYLLLVFRSLLIPVKAVLMNLLATFAAFGLTTWVFADGHLEGVFNFTSVGFIQTFLPIMVFALLFGLSMDYEVFLVGRMQEEWLRTHDNDQAVVAGVAHTARVITAAAAIMAAVFGCFIVADVLELKEFGFALAVAVVLDATLIRLLVVPAVMKVAGGSANWWLPRWLKRILPDLRLE
ncbi:MAG TPA: MMPL family transporter [Actinomycetota bacterium]|nr:MMPL family transporter [Actinomycetota bacterium]